MKYHTRVMQNEIIVEVQIALDPGPAAGFISARKMLAISQDGQGVSVPPATVRIRTGFGGDIDLDEVEAIQRWLNEAAKMARLLDDHVTSLAAFEAGYEVRQVAGTLILDKAEAVEAGGGE